LPDSGADISAAGPQLLQENTLNLLPFEITPRMADGHSMEPIGKFPITFNRQGCQNTKDVHIYPHVSGVIISWKAAKGFCTLPSQYPWPIPIFSPSVPRRSYVKTLTSTPEASVIISKYFTVFDGQIRIMQGEEFRICLGANTKPFCVHTYNIICF